MRRGELAFVLLISIVLVVLGAAVASATGAEANKFSGNQRFEAGQGPGLSLEESIKEAYKRITPAGGWPAFAEFVTCTGKPGGMQGMHYAWRKANNTSGRDFVRFGSQSITRLFFTQATLIVRSDP